MLPTVSNKPRSLLSPSIYGTSNEASCRRARSSGRAEDFGGVWLDHGWMDGCVRTPLVLLILMMMCLALRTRPPTVLIHTAAFVPRLSFYFTLLFLFLLSDHVMAITNKYSYYVNVRCVRACLFFLRPRARFRRCSIPNINNNNNNPNDNNSNNMHEAEERTHAYVRVRHPQQASRMQTYAVNTYPCSILLSAAIIVIYLATWLGVAVVVAHRRRCFYSDNKIK